MSADTINLMFNMLLLKPTITLKWYGRIKSYNS